MSIRKADHTIDTTGRACPIPVMNTKLALNRIPSGQVLEVITDDQGSEADIPVLVGRLGHELLQIIRTDHAFHFLIRKA